MKKFLKITGISLLAIILVYLVLCIAAPPFAVEKSIVINAKDSLIFSKIGDFKQWDSWSYWAEKDPGIPTSSIYGGTPYTKDHQVEWKSEKEGSGKQVIVEIKPYSYIKTALYFQEGSEPGYSEFKLSPEGNGTKLTWNMKGKMPFMFKGVGLIMGMNKMLGSYFTKSLANLKRECEK